MIIKPCVYASLITIFTLCIVTSSCKDNNKNVISGNESYALTNEQINDLSNKGEKGNAAASLKLYNYYEFVMMDYGKSFYWLKKSAENGQPVAQYNLAKRYLQDDEHKDQNKSIYWMNKAAQQGYTAAREAMTKKDKP